MAVVQALGEALAVTGKTLVGVGLTHTGDAKRGAAIEANPRSAVARDQRVYRARRAHHPRRDPAGHPQHAGPAWLHPNVDKDRPRHGRVRLRRRRRQPLAAGHVLDIGRLYRLALEAAPAGAQLYGAAEQGITVREIAETIGRRLDLLTVSIPAEQAADHFKTFPFITLDITMLNAETRQLLGWEPVQPGLIADLEQGHYFTTS